MNLEQCVPQIPVVIMGEDKFLDVKLLSQLSGDPIDLSAATEIQAILLKADSTYLIKKLSTAGITLVSGPGGHFQIILTQIESALLRPSPLGAYSDLEIHFTIAGLLTIVLLPNSVSIVSKLFP